MNSFIYNTPTKIVFEEDGVKQLGKLLKEQKCKKIMIVYGGKSAEKSGLIDEVKDIIKSENLEYVILNKIVSNPLLSKVYEGIELGKKENIDYILSVGGGSVIDTAKAIGMGLYNDGDVWDFYEGKREAKGCMPNSVILTIPAAGSEMSNSTVITKDEGMIKRGCKSDESICKFAILDPKLTLTLPNYQTACGCVDILMHTMERYFNSGENLELTDSISEALLRTVIKYAIILKENPNDIEARWNVMWAGSLSHNGLTNCGNNRGDWATHNIEHELSGKYDVAHGAGLAAVWGSWARYVVDIIPKRFEKYAINVMGIEKQEKSIKTALKGIEAMEEFYRKIDMPTNLKELGINPSKEDIDEMALKATTYNTRTLGTVKQLETEDIKNIFNAANT